MERSALRLRICPASQCDAPPESARASRRRSITSGPSPNLRADQGHHRMLNPTILVPNAGDSRARR